MSLFVRWLGLDSLLELGWGTVEPLDLCISGLGLLYYSIRSGSMSWLTYVGW
jgi:hypothetical protein